MEKTNGYIHDGKWNDDAANGQYLFAKKNGKEYFLKRFREPKYPKDGVSSKFFEEKKRECERWKKERKEIITALQTVAAGGGNIVSPLEIFLDRPCYVQATYKVDTSTKNFKEIVSISESNRILLLKTLSMSIKRVHSVDIVHGDLKPDNILISETQGGKLVCKIIDFDDSYFSQKPPLPRNTVGTEPYWSPELAIYKISDDKSKAGMITCKSDIFALGLIFHQYCTGGNFPDLYGYENAYQAVCAGKVLRADDNIKPDYLKKIINQMLLLNPADRPKSEDIFLLLSNQHSDDVENSSERISLKVLVKGTGGNASVNGKSSVLVDKGKEVLFLAKPDEGYELDSWDIGGKYREELRWSMVAKNNMTVIVRFRKITGTVVEKWPKVEYVNSNAKKVRVTFEDGKERILDKDIAEIMGWKV